MIFGFLLRRRPHFAITAALSAAVLATAAPSWTSAVPSASRPAQLPGVYRLRLGDFQITSLSDGTVPQDLHKLLTGTTTTDDILRLIFSSFCIGK